MRMDHHHHHHPPLGFPYQNQSPIPKRQSNPPSLTHEISSIHPSIHPSLVSPWSILLSPCQIPYKPLLAPGLEINFRWGNAMSAKGAKGFINRPTRRNRARIAPRGHNAIRGKYGATAGLRLGFALCFVVQGFCATCEIFHLRVRPCRALRV